jgi:asparagine synthase (glutamine-hydrolysing)
MTKIDSMVRSLDPETLLAGRYQLTAYRLWFRDELSDYVKDVLLDPRSVTRPYLNREAAVRIVRGHVDGRANFTEAINKLMTIELIQRTLIES